MASSRGLARAISASFDGGGVGAGSAGAEGRPLFMFGSVACGEPHAGIHTVNRTATTTRVVTRRFYTLDTFFLIALERETARGEMSPARRFLPTLRGRQRVVSIVSVEELLEGAVDGVAAPTSLQRFAIQGLHLAQVQRYALLQRRARAAA